MFQQCFNENHFLLFFSIVDCFTKKLFWSFKKLIWTRFYDNYQKLDLKFFSVVSCVPFGDLMLIFLRKLIIYLIFSKKNQRIFNKWPFKMFSAYYLLITSCLQSSEKCHHHQEDFMECFNRIWNWEIFTKWWHNVFESIIRRSNMIGFAPSTWMSNIEHNKTVKHIVNYGWNG